MGEIPTVDMIPIEFTGPWMQDEEGCFISSAETLCAGYSFRLGHIGAADPPNEGHWTGVAEQAAIDVLKADGRFENLQVG